MTDMVKYSKVQGGNRLNRFRFVEILFNYVCSRDTSTMRDTRIYRIREKFIITNMFDPRNGYSKIVILLCLRVKVTINLCK